MSLYHFWLDFPNVVQLNNKWWWLSKYIFLFIYFVPINWQLTNAQISLNWIKIRIKNFYFIFCFFNKLKNGQFKNMIFMIILSPNVCFPYAPYSVIVLEKAFMKEGICCCTDRITTAWVERDKLHAAEWAYILVRSSKRNSERFPLGFRVQSDVYIIEHSVTDYFLVSFGQLMDCRIPYRFCNSGDCKSKHADLK
jgi:hypothetical protein